MGARFGACTSTWNRGMLSATTSSYKLTGSLYRAWDWSLFSFELGIELGAAVFWQRFETAGEAPSRVTFAPVVGPRLTLGLDFGAGIFGALDVVADTYVLATQAPHEPATTGLHVSLRSSLAIGKRL